MVGMGLREKQERTVLAASGLGCDMLLMCKAELNYHCIASCVFGVLVVFEFVQVKGAVVDWFEILFILSFSLLFVVDFMGVDASYWRLLLLLLYGQSPRDC